LNYLWLRLITPLRAGKLTIKIFVVGQGLAEDCFSHTPHPRQPHHRPLPPGVFNDLKPKVPRNHTQPYLYIVSLNATLPPLGIVPPGAAA
jgi:hypothetical protein